MKVEDAKVTKKLNRNFFCSLLTQVTGYEGYKKKSFLELPSVNDSSSSKRSSPSAEEEPVKIVIKEDIRKRPSSSKSKSSSKKHSS